MTAVHLPPLQRLGLLADVGGTNARFAWQADANAEIEAPITLPLRQLPDARRRAARVFAVASEGPHPPACSIAIANPVVGRSRDNDQPSLGPSLSRRVEGTDGLRTPAGSQRLHCAGDGAGPLCRPRSFDRWVAKVRGLRARSD